MTSHLPFSACGQCVKGLNHCQQLLFLLGMGQDHLSMAQQRRELEQLCNELSYKKQKILLTEEQEFCAPMEGISCTQHKTYVLLMGRDV